MKKFSLLSLACLLSMMVIAQKPMIRKDIYIKNVTKEQRVTAEPGEKITQMTTSPKRAVPFHGDNANLVTVLNLGTSANVLGFSSGTRTMVWADDDLNAVINIHRMGPGSTPPSLSGYLAMDIGVNLGLTSSNWTVNRQVYSATLVSSPYYYDAARYPSAAIYNPSGNTTLANAYLAFFAPNFANLVVSGFGGYSHGSANLVTASDTSKILRWYNPKPHTYIPDGFTVSTTGIAHMVDADMNVESGSVVYQDSVIYGRGIWNASTHEFNYTYHTMAFPCRNMDNAADCEIAASPDGNTVWMSVLTNYLYGTPLIDSTYYPLLRKSTDGGLTWSTPIPVYLDGPNGIPGIKNQYSDYFIQNFFTGPPFPTRDEIPYTTAFDHGLSVDQWGNPHIAVAVGYAPGGYSISTGVDSLINVYDIFSQNGGTTWHAVWMGALKTFRGTWGDYSSDNRVYISRNAVGNKMFITWNDTRIDGESNNQNPDVYARGFDLLTNKLTSDNGTARPDNVTFLSDITQEAYWQCASPIVFTDNSKYTIPIVTQWFADPAGSAQFKYIPDFAFYDSEFTVSVSTPPFSIGVIAGFTAAPLSGNAPLIVQFTNQSSGSPTSYAWNFGDPASGSLNTSSLQNPTHNYTLPGVYSVTLTVTGSSGSNTLTKSNYISVTSSGNHFVPVWTGNPLYPMSIAVTQAIIDLANMTANDEIGVFDGTTCVGAIKLSSTINPVNPPFITVSKDDPATPAIDGYTEGHTIIYKLWKNTTSLEVSNVTHTFPYAPAYAFETFVQNETAVVSLAGISAVTQNIGLLEGWNIVSFNNQPANMNLLNILQPLVSSNNLVKVIDEAGNIIQNFPWGWVNNIGSMAITEGYYMKVNSTTNLSVTGSPIQSPTTIPFIAGWNIMGYPAQTAQNALTVFQPLIASGALIKVIDEAGNIIQNFPWGWVNNIGNLQAGEGYYVKVANACSLTVTNLKETSVVEKPEALIPVHFKPPYNGNPFEPMAIGLMIEPGTMDQLPPGLELGIFDGTLCVGAYRFGDSAPGHIVFAASMDDPDTPEADGFTAGNLLQFKWWEPKTGSEILAEPAFTEGESTFASRGTYIGTLKGVPIAREKDASQVFTLGFNRPNPVSSSAVIPFEIFKTCHVTLSIHNSLGIKIREIVNETMAPGQYSIPLQAEDLTSGCYYYSLNATADGLHGQMTRKMILMK